MYTKTLCVAGTASPPILARGQRRARFFLRKCFEHPLGQKTETNILIFKIFQEDVNGEKLTVKKWWIFGADFFHFLVPIFSRFTPIFHGFKGF